MLNTVTEPAAAVAGLFSLIVRHAGARPHCGAAGIQASAFVAVLFQPEAKKAVVLMTDGNFGASITNSAEELLGFIQDAHLGKLGVDALETRWLYRDSEGDWDEILPKGDQVVRRYQVSFRAVGNRSQMAALACIKAEGFELGAEDLESVRAFLRLV